MSAVEALRLAQESGIHLSVAGADLILDAKREPTSDVLEAIKRHKAGIVALLAADNGARPAPALSTAPKDEGPVTPLGAIAAKSRLAPTNLDPAEWRDFLEERAAILQHYGGAPREQAERLAYEAAVAAIGWVLPAGFPADQCAACGGRLVPPRGLPLSDTALVCDATCHLQHRHEQRERAIRQLGVLGVEAPE